MWKIPSRLKPAKAALTIFNLLGQEIRTLMSEEKPAGYFVAHWDGRDGQRKRVGSGIYVYRIEAGEFIDVKKLLLLQ